MASEKALAVVLRTTDWSETSRIATLWTRELGKVRGLAKGGRRLRSNFESAIDLLTVCSIVLLRKSSGGLDLLTEAQVVRRFPNLTRELSALYAGYYVAELLADLTEENDPHPLLFDEALQTLEALGQPDMATGPRVARFELVLLRELGYRPSLDACVTCGTDPGEVGLAFSPAAGGVLCPACRAEHKDRRPLSPAAREALSRWSAAEPTREESAEARAEVRQVLNHYVTYLLGRRPRLLPYLGS